MGFGAAGTVLNLKISHSIGLFVVRSFVTPVVRRGVNSLAAVRVVVSNVS